ncbi:mediator of RNA polymerase II transcription subunit 5 [Emericellopsis atlantica]|uniref:Mediator of RNA polymerase II transcription subunit 5 n=1 Tax=Emericellopsis atlantica TaxID=2614577 RepID=A0A9P7ZN91_9HYPO|nr:mediator of RNA polymerase II transcription subunit 5 [Emericellopsis atlantica]KAG9255248.1 mediator of RNA polymerase II transcription subunit 5 [Emericellopsis atlantica]
MDNQPVADSLRKSLFLWTEFARRCLNERLPIDKFQTFARLLYQQHHLPPAAIADLFLRPHPNDCYSIDPRIPPYLQKLSDLGCIDTPAILKTLYKYSSAHLLLEEQSVGSGSLAKDTKTPNGDSADAESKPLRWKSSYWVEEVLFFRIVKSLHEGEAVRNTTTAYAVLQVVSQWIALFVATASTAPLDVMSQASSLRMELGSAKAAFVPLLMRLTDNEAVLRIVSRPIAREICRELSANLADFLPQLANAGTSRPMLDKLEYFRNNVLASSEPVDKKKQAVDAAMNDMLDSAAGPDSFEVRQVPIISTRTGMYIHLNACLAGRPLINDNVFISFLNNRYAGDNQHAAMDLILASFDILATAVFRSNAREDAPLLRSFLINKVPPLLFQLLPPGFSPQPAETCITNALNQVDTGLFPTASAMFNEDQISNPYTSSVREEFCGACVLHGLINRERLEAVLGEMPMSSQPEKKIRDKLVQDYLSHNLKPQDLLADLDRDSGNVGTVCHAIAEIIRRQCHEKDTMSLKLLCIELVQKPQSLDILLLFESIPTVLGPLCQLLDHWRYEEDQAEYQPVYEEFGSILLLALAFVYRYGLEPSDLGLYSPGSAVRKIITQSHVGRPDAQLSAREKEHVNGWLLGLFDTEAGGLGDDLMSSCPPQDFYCLAASLFQSIVVGYAHGYITDEALKSGVEYLVDTFLLPALVPAIRFLTEYLWTESEIEQKAVIKILQLVLLPSAISSEANSLLASVKKIIAKPLHNALQTYLHRRDPSNQDIQPLLNMLKESVPKSRRLGGADMSEITDWCRTEPHGLWSSLKTTTHNLMQWTANPGLNMPTSYSHRQFITAARLMGPEQVLRLILEELRQQIRGLYEANGQELAHQPELPSLVHDVAAALICAPDVTKEPPAACTENPPASQQLPVQRLHTLREVLRLEAEKCHEIQKTDPVLADIVVRLYRRVEGLMALPQVPTDLLPPSNLNDMGAGMDMMNTDLNNMSADIDMGSAVMDDIGLNGGGDVNMNTGMESLAANNGHHDHNINGNDNGDMMLDGLPSMSGLDGPPGGDGDANLFDGLDDTNLDLDTLEWPDAMNMS